MNVLFCLLHFGYYRNFESVLRELARRGHRVHVGSERGEGDRGRAPIDALAAEYPSITLGALPGREADEYRDLAQRLRLGFDYLRYLEPDYRGMPGLRMRSADRAPTGLLELLEWPGASSLLGRRLVRSVLWRLERAVPPSRLIEEYLLERRPDVVVITPLLGVTISSQIDYLIAAKRLGIPVAFGVWSWDNLSSKAIVRDVPDRVLVWNATQRHEAMEFHGIPAENVAVTGAQCFDRWFDRAPSRSREQFCRDVGLPADRPYVLYVGSTMVWKSPPEAEFVVRWLRHLRASSDPALRGVPVLIRPHPGRLEEWLRVDLSEFDAIGFSGYDPIRQADPTPAGIDPRADYFDALYYSGAVAGINTSAFIEAGIAGRPVCVVLADEFSGTQTGTIHFRYLTDIAGGLVVAGRAFDEHEKQLADALSGRAPHAERQRRFIEAFVRPYGLDQPATPRFVDAIEDLGRRPPRAAAPPVRAPRAAGAALRRLARFTSRGRGRRWLMNREESTAARDRARQKARRSQPAPQGASQPSHGMGGECLIVSYHYVRSPSGRFTRLRGLSPSEYESQLASIQRRSTVVHPDAVLRAVEGRAPLTGPSTLLTFDDGLVDHYETAFPLLRERGLSAIFFVSPTHDHRTVLNVQKVQLLLAVIGGEALERELEAAVPDIAARTGMPPRPGLYRYDSDAVRRVKARLNYELSYDVVDRALRELFERHVGREKDVAPELYLSESMIREMSKAGMVFGYHTVNHRVLSRLTVEEQRAELAGGVNWIKALTGQQTVPFCYPHGHAHAYSADTLRLVNELGYSMAFTAVRAMASPSYESRFELPRYDTRDVEAALAVAVAEP